MLQNHARKMRIPIDRLSFGFDVTSLDSPHEIRAQPSEGVFVHGLFLESAHWDKVSSGWGSHQGGSREAL